MLNVRKTNPVMFLIAATLFLLFVPAQCALSYCCEEPNNGDGTVNLPPDCPYDNEDANMLIINGLPPDSTIQLDGPLQNFNVTSHVPGGPLGGEVITFSGWLDWTISGTGDFAGFSRHILMPVSCIMHSGPRNPGDPVQVIQTEMYHLSGEVFGDPDFCTFRIRAGADYDLASPGQTTLTELPSGDYAVDSFFDITYQIEFEGCPGSQLDGMSGITTDTIQLYTCEPHQLYCCEEPNNGDGTVDLPPDCPYDNNDANMVIIGGLPPGTTIQLVGPLENFNVTSRTPGGPLGGEVISFTGQFTWSVVGTDSLAGFNRSIAMPVDCIVHTGPRTLGDSLQIIRADMFELTGELFGDPDFCTFRVRAGEYNGLPSPGRTILTELPNGKYAVDSFFDITYEIEFEGCPGSQLEDYAGTTTDTIQLYTCEPGPPLSSCCEEPNNGTGTIDFPAASCTYDNRRDTMIITEGLPAGSTIILDGSMNNIADVLNYSGGSLGGEVADFNATFTWDVTGTGDLAGFNRSIQMPFNCTAHIGPRTPGDPVQTFSNKIFSLSGELFGDPDFCTLRITAGTDNSLPSSGQTILTEIDIGDGAYNVDSFFDITYQIEFEGCPASLLDGMSGTTTDAIRLRTCEKVDNYDNCIGINNGQGSTDMPPVDCNYHSPYDVWEIIDGLPTGTTIELDTIIQDFENIPRTFGGSLGGDIEVFDSTLDMTVTGTGSLEGFNRHLSVPAGCEVHTGPRDAGSPVQIFDMNMVDLDAELFGDPDFCTFRVKVGVVQGLPGSPGQTTLTQLPNGDFAVDSFFDITYQIEFEGCPGSQLEDYLGTTIGGPIRISTCCCPRPVNMDGTGDVNLWDLDMFVTCWLHIGGCSLADFDLDGKVNIDDYARIADAWLSTP